MNALADVATLYWHFLCHAEPLNAVLAGEPTPDAVLFRESMTDHHDAYHAAGLLLDEVSALPSDGLDAQERATLALMRHELGIWRARHEVGAHWRPSLFPSGPALWVSHYANTTAVTDGASAELYAERLATVPAYLADLAETLAYGHRQDWRYPRHVLEIAAAATRSSFAGEIEALPFLGPFRRSPSAANPALQRAAERVRALVRDELVPAFERFAAFLLGPLAEGARTTLACTDGPLGREFYRTAVREFTTAELTPEEIHELGLAEVARIERAMEAVAADAGFAGDLPGYRAHLAGPDYIAPSKDALLLRIEALAKRVDRRIPSLFGNIPRMTYGVELLPEAVAARMPPAYAQPNPADRSTAGIFWLTSLPERCPSTMHLPLVLHEGWPGHLMHIALMQEQSTLPAFRRHGASRYHVCVEGWALYCEGLGLDMGLYREPHEHFGRLDMEIWRAYRLVVDTGIHWFGWSREQAVDTMAAGLALSRATIEGEVDRYIAWPGQALAYQVGNLEFRALRKHAETTLGDRFDHRAFHDTLTGAGAVSLPVLRQLVDEWLQGHSRA